MSALLQAVNGLKDSVSKLESAAAAQAKSRASAGRKAQAAQIDLFAQSAAANQRGKYVADPAALARKLDVAIEKVEQILREA